VRWAPLGAALAAGMVTAPALAQAPPPIASFQVLTQADAEPTQRAPAPKKLVFDASGSASAAGPIVSYTWDFGDRSTPVTTAEPRITKSFRRFGRFTVRLIATDAAGQGAEASRQVTIRRPLTKSKPIGRTRARATRVLGWAAATKLLQEGFDVRRERPRNLVAPGGNITACRPNETVIAFLFQYAGIPRERTVQLRLLLDGRPFSGGGGVIGSPTGADSYAVSTRVRGGRLPQGRYEARVILGGKTLVSSYVDWSC
jgi:hypothetical protein